MDVNNGNPFFLDFHSGNIFFIQQIMNSDINKNWNQFLDHILMEINIKQRKRSRKRKKTYLEEKNLYQSKESKDLKVK